MTEVLIEGVDFLPVGTQSEVSSTPKSEWDNPLGSGICTWGDIFTLAYGADCQEIKKWSLHAATPSRRCIQEAYTLARGNIDDAISSLVSAYLQSMIADGSEMYAAEQS